MEEVLVELVEPLVIVCYAIIAAGLTLVGAILEYLAVAGAAGGGLPRLWMIFMGGVIATFGLLMARDKLLPALTQTG